MNKAMDAARMILVLAIVATVGCSTDPTPGAASAPVPSVMPGHRGSTPRAHWQHSSETGFCCDSAYDRCIDDGTQRVIIEVMMLTTGLYGVYENGSRLGEYTTLAPAKKAATDRHPECAGEPANRVLR
jgi:hypothetical protein